MKFFQAINLATKQSDPKMRILALLALAREESIAGSSFADELAKEAEAAAGDTSDPDIKLALAALRVPVPTLRQNLYSRPS